MARRLIARGHEVTMVCGSNSQGKTGLNHDFSRGKRTGNVDGINLIEFDLSVGNKDGFIKRTIIFLRYALRAIFTALREPADIVFATTTPLTAAIPGIAAKWLRRKPFVFEVRDLWPELPKAMGVIKNPVILGAMSMLEWAAYKSADRLIGLSPGIVNGIARRGIKRDKITLAPNGCDLGLFKGAAEKWRPKGAGADDFLAIFTGTHGKANGLNALVDAAAILKKQNAKNIKIALVGDGMEKSGLMQRAKGMQLQDYLIFCDPVPKTQLAGLMQSADIGLQILANVPAFYYGTSPNKFFDYLAAGLPVLTNYPGWVADLVTQHDCGMGVAPDQPAALARALLKLQSAPQTQRAQMAENAALLAKSEFDREAIAANFIDTLMQAAPAKGAA